ncbi:uncharacterized protein LOC109598289 isoform X2 [Aethina tumida]|uniref:uncharacterized protein LOC109598289 isoform X2 n=1 Tax=Aethina tumida TaxID=116153 RepID=UPI00214835C9|nr:uncharacterized protein LOC109598289 isoform X2 [Aethina tumida]
MPTQSFVTSTIKNDIKCSLCHGYLSHFPVYITASENICGRCPHPEGSIRNSIYETLASTYKFPCMYDVNGCLHNDTPEKINEHEKFCSYRLIECPVLIDNEKCSWRDRPTEVLTHFEQCHPTYILQNAEFELSFSPNLNMYYLLPHFEDFFFVLVNVDKKVNICKMNIEYVGNNPKCLDYDIRIIFQTVNKSVEVTSTHKLGQSTFDIQHTKKQLNDPVAIICHIDMFKEKLEKITQKIDDKGEEFLQELECPVCFLYMVPPIMQCEKGHSMCKGCTDQLTQCPTCKAPIKLTQNFALEKISRIMTFPCKNDRCDFKGKSNVIKEHETSCIWGPLLCPFNNYGNCCWSDILENLYDHINKDHYENLLEMEQVVIPFTGEDFEDCFVLKFNLKLFMLHLEYEENVFKFAIQLLGQREECAKYKFNIDIIDFSQQNRRFYFSDICSKYTPKEQAFINENYYTVNYEQIRNMITDCFGFRLSICVI